MTKLNKSNDKNWNSIIDKGFPPFSPNLHHEVLAEQGFEHLGDNIWVNGNWRFEIIKHRLKLTGIYFEGALKSLNKNGFMKRYASKNRGMYFIQEKDNVLEEVSLPIMEDFFKHNLMEATGGYSSKAVTETFNRQKHNLFNERALVGLQTHSKEIMRDEKDRSYLLFKNTIVITTNDGYTKINYKRLGDKCVWKDQIIKRDFNFRKDWKNSHIHKFLINVSRDKNKKMAELKLRSKMTGIGYLMHNFKKEGSSEIAILVDEVITNRDSPEGGTGKGIIMSAIGMMRVLLSKDGKKFSKNDRFAFQGVNISTQVLFIDDVNPDFDFDRLNHLAAEGFVIENKFQDEFLIPHEISPKLAISSNNVPNQVAGVSRERRQFLFEVGPYYNKIFKAGNRDPLVNVHGCSFFGQEWNRVEWNRFYSAMLNYSIMYFKEGLIDAPKDNFIKNAFRQKFGDEFFDIFFGDPMIIKCPMKKTPLRNIAELFRGGIDHRKLSLAIKFICQLNRWSYSSTREGNTNIMHFEIKDK